ncbi:hypothetical protein MTR_6g065680 [Medicago truncatula]|uniref:Uncharacterized protein n=1 Tax=Medicago truncatula TaxID=3880 RepID=G7KPA3_MEDTR|nr:hypothetical protein MTR_6g065680 [Medicago truncatula]
MKYVKDGDKDDVIEDDLDERDDEPFQHVESLLRYATRRVSVGSFWRVYCTRLQGAWTDVGHRERIFCG